MARVVASFFYKNSSRHQWITLGFVLCCVICFSYLANFISSESALTLQNVFMSSVILPITLGYLVTYLYYYFVTVYAEQDKEQIILRILSDVIYLKNSAQSLVNVYGVARTPLNELYAKNPETHQYLTRKAAALVDEENNSWPCIGVNSFINNIQNELPLLASAMGTKQEMLSFMISASEIFQSMTKGIGHFFINTPYPCNLDVKHDMQNSCQHFDALIEQKIAGSPLATPDVLYGLDVAKKIYLHSVKLKNPQISEGCLGEQCVRLQMYQKGQQALLAQFGYFDTHLGALLHSYSDGNEVGEFLLNTIKKMDDTWAQVVKKRVQPEVSLVDGETTKA